ASTSGSSSPRRRTTSTRSSACRRSTGGRARVSWVTSSAPPEVPETGRTGGMKIRAAVLEEFGKPLEVQELDLAEPKAGEVPVRRARCGVCHTDLYTASGADPSGYAPAVLGQEGAGVVEAVG